MPASETAPSRFPLPLDIVEQHIGVYGDFSDTQLKLIEGSNAPQDFNGTSPLEHMWDFNEDPMLTHLMRFADMHQRPYPNVLPQMRVYRAAACLGEIMVRAREDQLTAQGHVLPPVQLDPLRHYLVLPEAVRGDDAGRYLAQRHTGSLQHHYIDTAVRHGYFTEEAATQSLRDLRDVWQRADMKYLFPTEEDPANFFGEICRGMMQTIRLHKLGEQEAVVAPWDAQYNPALHMALGNEITPRDAYTHKLRRIATHVRVAGATNATPDGEDWYGGIPDGTAAISLQRGLMGYVPVPGAPDHVQSVLFKRSLQAYILAENDVLIIRRSVNEQSEILRYPFRVAVDEHEYQPMVQALCRNGSVIEMDSPIFAPHDSFYAAVDVVLTGASALYELGVDEPKVHAS